MDIERINENTVKFFISYGDIEDRGFDREEIWYSRERSEELFWDMMDEVHHREKFSVEGPLWIQVQAMESGLEVIVTKAQFSKDGEKLELPVSDDNHIDVDDDETMESLLKKKQEQDDEDEVLEFVIRFRDFEDLIQLAHRFTIESLHNELYSFEDQYYLYVSFDEESEEDRQEDTLSLLLEYGMDSRLSVHRLKEYGKVIFAEEALSQVQNLFKLY
ncbi:adaptor protein MecA [Bacillaceae bacterium SIJ1]|uniref:adaptor protein MecA n=1 Tax=Litoribacterium kuwaitense TaxID=1398745 RepID=UPI0013EAAC68|nr:adaptor protein MecA [Litoribacterium kuwaitense]NGP44578.1 adaptor protein MecA [Litoribacterium kuwaitense]